MEPDVVMYNVFGFTWLIANYGWKYSSISFYCCILYHQSVLGIEAISYIAMGTMYLNKLARSYVESIGLAKLDFYGFNQMAWIFMALLLGIFCFF